MSENMRIKRPDSLSKFAEEDIRQGIIRGRYQLGDSLPKSRLSAEMGISKTPIREALAVLSFKGLVRIFPQRGAFVFTLSQEDVVQLCGFRMILESAAIDQALKQNADILTDELHQIVSAMSGALEAGKLERYLDLDADFHDAFFKHCGNSYLREGYQKVSDIVRTMRTHLSKTTERTAKSFSEHEAIALHLKEGKLTAARNVLKRQITRGERAYSDLAG